MPDQNRLNLETLWLKSNVSY